ncbi:ABC transporter permease [bacterium]|nr:ABC transporter permease [bacterium]
MLRNKSAPAAKTILSLFYFILYLPLMILVIYSFSSTPLPSSFSGFTFDWYKKLFHDREILESFLNSFIVATSTTALCIFFSLLLIYYKTIGGRIKKIIPLFYGNLMIPDTVLAIALVSFFAFLKIPLGMITIIIAHSIVGLGLSIPLMYLRYKDLSPSLLEASATLGASSWTTFKRIVLPFMLPTLLGTGLMIFILSFDDFILTYFCAGATNTLSLFLVSSLRLGISPEVNALTTAVMLFTSLLVMLLFLLRRKEEMET